MWEEVSYLSVYTNIIQKLKEAGYTTYRLQREKLIGQSTMTKIRNGEPISTKTIDTICRLAGCQPGDIIKYVNEKR